MKSFMACLIIKESTFIKECWAPFVRKRFSGPGFLFHQFQLKTWKTLVIDIEVLYVPFFTFLTKEKGADRIAT